MYVGIVILISWSMHAIYSRDHKITYCNYSTVHTVSLLTAYLPTLLHKLRFSASVILEAVHKKEDSYKSSIQASM